MGLFNRKQKTLTKEQQNIRLAKDILESLGEEKDTYSASLAFGGGYYHDMCYEGYGLKIVDPDITRREEKGIYILFNEKRVQDSTTYHPGSWEEVLYELHARIPIILERRENQTRYLNRRNGILTMINQIAAFNDYVEVSDTIRIEGSDVCTGYDDEHYQGRKYTVYENEEIVFSGHKDMIYGDKFYKYTPGSWEEEINDCLYRTIEERKRKEIERTEALSADSLKQLRKLR